MKKCLILFFFALCFGAASVSSVSACVCVPVEGVKKELRKAGVVFSGTFVGTEYRKGSADGVVISQKMTSGNDGEQKIVALKFRVDSWWKGKSTREVLIFTDRTISEDGSQTITDCDFPFEIGKRYLVYAFSDEKQLKTNACTRTKEIGKAGEDLKILGKGRKPLKR